MKVLQLNVWTGRVKGALRQYFLDNQFDVICLQEAVWAKKTEMLEYFLVSADQIKKASRLKHELRSANWQMNGFGAGNVVNQGNVILSRQEIVETRVETVYGEQLMIKEPKDFSKQGYTLQIAKLKNGVFVVNHHGYWIANSMGNKTSVAVMKKVAKIIKELDGPVIMCGDLNVVHASPAMRELDFLRDLTAEYKIKNTLVGLKYDGEVACDHILVNDKVKVRDFKLEKKVVSDHFGLIAEVDA